MNAFFKTTSALLLSISAFAAHAATQSVTVNYTLTVPTACTLSDKGTAINKVLPHDGTDVNQSISIKCNVAYAIKATSINQKGLNQSAVVNTTDSSLSIPYDITITGGPSSVKVNDSSAVTVAPSSTTKTDTYTLSAKTPLPISIEDYIAGEYKDSVNIEIIY